jgi:HAD superfamily hydrolase (TIGR01509 family)
MDGLLVDSEPLYKQAWQQAASDLGFDFSDDVYFKLLGLPEKAAEAAVVDVFGESFSLLAFRDRWKRIWSDLAEGGDLQSKAGAHDLLRTLRAAGIPIGLATSSEREYAVLSLERTALIEYFDPILTAEDVERGKPAPDLYRLAASRIGVSTDRCLVLEDSPAGVEAGLAAGMAVIIVPDLLDPPVELAKRAQLVVTNLEEAKPHVLRAVGLA